MAGGFCPSPKPPSAMATVLTVFITGSSDLGDPVKPGIAGKEQRMGNGDMEWGTGNGEQGTGNGEQGTGDGEQGTGDGDGE